MGGLIARGLVVVTMFAAIGWAPAAPCDAGDNALANWPCFRGPASAGAAPDAGKLPSPLKLEADTIFDVPVPAKGAGSPILWGDHIYLSGQGGMVMAFDRSSGKLLWQTALHVPVPPGQAADDKQPANDKSSGPAYSTPVTDGKCIYAFFSDGVLGCVDSSGKQVWARRLAGTGPRNQYGLAASPVLYGDTLIQIVDRGTEPAASGSFIVAVRTSDGTDVWRKDRPTRSSWTTPLVTKGRAGDVLVTTAAPLVIAYDPKSGAELWRTEGSDNPELVISPTPCGEGVALMETRHGLTAFKVAGNGNRAVTLWTTDVDPPRVSSPAYEAGNCYLISNGDLTCIDAATGKLKWKLPLDGEFWPSPIIAGDRVYAINNDGMMFVVSTSGKSLEQVDLGKQVQATPAIVGGRIFIRTEKSLICLGQP